MPLSEQLLRVISPREFYEGYGLRLEEVGTNEYKTLCPFHDDHHPSFTINRTSGLFKCHAASCGVSGNMVSFYAKKYDIPLGDAAAKLSEEYLSIPELKKEVEKVVRPEIVEELHQNLLQSEPLIKLLQNSWGISLESVKRFKLGFRRGYVTIPVMGFGGMWINIQYHRLHPGPRKIFSYSDETGKGYGGNNLYPIDQLKSSTLIWTSGPKDAITLLQHGYSSISPLDGEGSFEDEWLGYFENKEIIILLDNDEGGRKGTERVARKLLLSARKVLIATLEGAVPTGKDINDFFLLGKTAAELNSILENAKLYSPELIPSRMPKVSLPPDVYWPELPQRIVNFLRGITDAPLVYLRASAVICLSSAISDLLMITPDRLHPNLWVLLLGRTARFRKTTVLRKSVV